MKKKIITTIFIAVIYYIDKDYLKMYSDKTGIKTILKNSELKFNKNLEFYIY